LLFIDILVTFQIVKINLSSICLFYDER